MTLDRISLQEAYDNRDVVAWLVRHQDRIDELFNSLDAWLVAGNNLVITDNTDNTRTIDLKSTITGPIAFSSYITSVARAYAAANVNDVITIGSLMTNPTVIHSTGNETKTGNLTVDGTFTTTQNLNVKKNQPRTSLSDTANKINDGVIVTGDRGFFALYDANGTIMADLIINIDNTGKCGARIRARNADGTTRQAVLI